MKTLKALKLPLIATLVGFFIGGIVIALSGFNPFEAIRGLLVGGFGSTYYLTTTLTRATPIIFAGLAGALAWGSGYPSLGAAGQMVMGAMVSAMVAVVCPGPSFFVVIVSLLAGILAGMAYSLISIWVSERFQLYLLIITLMMNYIADYIASYLTAYVVKDPLGMDSSAIQTQLIQDSILPKLIKGYTLHWGFILAVLAVLIIYFIMKKTTFGYKAKMGGLNPQFANYGGIKSSRMMYYVLLLSGALAGLGGACEVLGTRYRYVDGMITSPGYAWSGIIASLMSSNHPIGILVSAIFLAGLTTGGSTIERSMGVPSEVTIIIQGIITLLITAKFTIKFSKKRSAKNKEAK
ncbi:MAG: ABC transporter permease [Cellulosilyticaceae bacterium]